MKPNHYKHAIEAIVSVVMHGNAQKKATKAAWINLQKLALDHSRLKNDQAALLFEQEARQLLHEAYDRLRRSGIKNPAKVRGMSGVRRNISVLTKALALGIDIQCTRNKLEKAVREVEVSKAQGVTSNTTAAVVNLAEAAREFVQQMMESGFDSDSIVAAVVEAATAPAPAEEKRKAA